MSQLNVKLDLKDFKKAMGSYADQAPFVVSKTINDVMKVAQTNAYAHYMSALNIRREQFLKRSIKIAKFAKKNDLTGIIGVGNLGNKITADILAKFEKAGPKIPYNGGRIAIPTSNVKLRATGVVAKSELPKNLKKKVEITTKKGQQVLFTRKGKGKKSELVAKYILKPVVQLDKRTDFQSLTVQYVRANLGSTFKKNFEAAIKTRR